MNYVYRFIFFTIQFLPGLSRRRIYQDFISSPFSEHVVSVSLSLFDLYLVIQLIFLSKKTVNNSVSLTRVAKTLGLDSRSEI